MERLMSPTANPTATPAAPAARGQSQTIDLADKIRRIEGHWQPRVVAEMNDYQFKVVKVLGDFPWHRHAETDETFLVLDGELRIEHRASPHDEPSVIVLRAGQMAVVPQGVEHRPSAEHEVKMLLIEPRGVVNTGDGAKGERTVANDQWV
jgi:mannose-6-phosphate isomerase-like protein (cupin superfamily)